MLLVCSIVASIPVYVPRHSGGPPAKHDLHFWKLSHRGFFRLKIHTHGHFIIKSQRSRVEGACCMEALPRPPNVVPFFG